MTFPTKLRLAAMSFVLGTATFAMSTFSLAQTPDQAPASAESASPWTTEQLLTSTVHDAWLLSGKDETKFFEMVKTLTEISVQKRGVTLPDTKEAGIRMGANIKRMAKADTDQLLYAVVDKAVMIASHAQPTPAGSKLARPVVPAQ